MRIHTKIVLRIETNEVLTDESYEYSGPLALAGGGGTNTVSENKSVKPYLQRLPEEIAAFDIGGDITKQILGDLGYNVTQVDHSAEIAELDAQRAPMAPGPERAKINQQIQKLKNDFTVSERALTDEEAQAKAIEDSIYGKSMATLDQGMSGDIPPAIREQINRIYEEEDRVGRQNLMRLGAEMSGARGMNMTDSPIANPLLREYANFSSALGAQKARDLIKGRSDELARSQLLREFQLGLGQQKHGNKMGMLGQISDVALGTYTPRFGVGSASSRTTQSGGGPSPWTTASQVMGGLGSLAQGATAFANWMWPAAAATAAASSEKFKEEIIPLRKKGYEKALEDVRDTALFSWQYKSDSEFDDGGKKHVGLIIERAPERFSTPDKEKLDVVDAIGASFGAIRTLADEFDELSEEVSDLKKKVKTGARFDPDRYAKKEKSKPKFDARKYADARK